MIIKSLELHNYRQHGHLKQEFEGNLVGVLGRNGTGKSHFMDSMEFAFAGKVAGQNKSDMLSWGAEEGSVTLTFEHDGVDGKIWRELHSTKAEFTFGDEDVVKGISKVNVAITQATGLDADICKQAVFVHQKEVDAVLFTEPSVRQLAWQRLCGLGESAATHKKLGEFISNLPEVTDYTDQIGEALIRIEEATVELNEAQENFQITDLGGLNPDEVQATMVKIAELRNAISAGISESHRLAEDQKQLHAAQKDILSVNAGLSVFLDDPAVELPTVTKRMNEAVASLTAIRRVTQHEEELSYGEEQLAALACAHTEDELNKAKEFADTTRGILAAAEVTLGMTSKLVQAISNTVDASTCPLCRQQVSGDLASTAQASFGAAQEAFNNSRAATDQAVDIFTRMESAVKDYNHRKGMLEKKIAGLAASLEEVKGNVTIQADEAMVAELQKRIGELNASVKVKQDLERRKTVLDTQVQTITETLQERSVGVDTLLADARRLMAESGVSAPNKVDERTAELEVEARKCLEVREEIARLKGQMAEMEKAIANLNQTVAELREREDKQAALKSVLDTLASVRGWFHYQKGPQAVINSLLERITSGVNDFLEKFGAGFYAIPDFGTTSFKYWYTDGRTPPADGYPPVSEMSGGEAVVLAVSFRFATYCLFASRIGLLTLDEPTVYLDDDNIGRFCNLLLRVKELATDMNLQIFISTHERPVMPFMDSTIQFGTYNTEEDEDDNEED